jgi:carboxypeptidase Taq
MNETRHIYDHLVKHLIEIKHLHSISKLFGWDSEVMMPAGASNVRSEQLSVLAGVIYDKSTDQTLGKIIYYLYNTIKTNNDKNLSNVFNEFEMANIREAKISYDKTIRITKELAQKQSKLEINAYTVWLKAREKNDWNIFVPALNEWIKIKKEICTNIDPNKPVYDTCIDEYDRGMTTDRLTKIFDELKPHVIDLVSKIKGKEQIDDSWLTEGKFNIDLQKKFNQKVAFDLGFDKNYGRLDTSVHPMCTGIDCTDVRITTKYSESNLLFAFTSTTHETGHALYEQNLNKKYCDLPVSLPLSMGMSESQSLLYERMVGLSENFLNFYYPELQKIFNLSRVPFERDRVPRDFYKSCNVVKPGLIRIKADELTYILHVIIRFEIERDMFDGTIEPSDVPSVWKQKMYQYLGIHVPNDKSGPLQDIHWAYGYFGYFPVYVLGAIYACQIYYSAKKEIFNLDEKISMGDFIPLKEWLTTNIYQKGSLKETSEQLLLDVTGEKINISLFVNYLRMKYSDIYNL